MAKMLITYYSRTKHTEHMAQSIAAGAHEIAGIEVSVLTLDQVDVRNLLKYDAIIIGSPCYYGLMAAEVKKFIDNSVSLHGKLDGKVGGAFASGANVGGGNETTVLSILHAMLIHGMVIQGSAGGDHYGPVAIGDVDVRAHEECAKLGRVTAELAVKLHG